MKRNDSTRDPQQTGARELTRAPYESGLRYQKTRRCHVRATGRTGGQVLLDWPSEFRRAMRRVSWSRGQPPQLPQYVRAAFDESEKQLLLWPAEPHDTGALPVRVYSQERWARLELASLFAEIGIPLPDGVVVEFPAVPRRSPTHGPCMALDLRRGEFLPKESRPAAVALLHE